MLADMVKAMVHEPFYVSGTYIHEPAGVYVGWSGFDNFSNACPSWNERGDVCLVFSGEHYTDPSEIGQLKANGHEFERAKADYLVHLYEETGNRFFEQLNGWFSGLLVDLRKQKLFLFNDRYGLNRIYYHESERGFYFASEAKSLLRVFPETRQLNFASLGEFFSCGCVLQNRTLFSGISLLPPASVWSFSDDQCVSRNAYFNKESWESRPTLSDEEYYEKLKALFPRVLTRYLQGSDRVGVSLTGGVDSRMIMAWANCAPGSLPCYTFGSNYNLSIDVKIARQVAQICQQPHTVIPLDSSFLDEFPALAEKTVYLSDGAMDVSGAADLFVNRVARQIAPVRLTGNYGGEILRELIAFKPVNLDATVFDYEFCVNVDNARATYARERQERPLSFVAFKQVPWHHYSRLSLERSQIVLRSPYLDNDIVELAYQTPPEIAKSNATLLRLIAGCNLALGRIGTDRCVFSKPIPVVTGVRHQLQEFTFKAEYAYDYGMPHWLAAIDSFLAPFHLERIFLGRHKFHHFRVWYRDALSSYLKEILLDPRTTARPYFRGKRLEEMVKQHTRGTRNHSLEFHRILTSELIQRQLIEQY